MCPNQSYLMDDSTTDKFDIDKKWAYSIFVAN